MITPLAVRLFIPLAFVVTLVSAGDRPLVGVFEGRTPCGEIAVAFTGFPAQNCEKIKWRLKLYRNQTYLYEGTRTKREGTWSLARGTAADRNAVVYRLKYGDQTLAVQKVDDNILLILDRDLRPLVGDASWNYTLCRTRARN